VATVLRNGNYRSFPSSQKALLSSCSGRYLSTAMYFPELFIPGRPEVNQSAQTSPFACSRETITKT
jgi:hypothetical protein